MTSGPPTTGLPWDEAPYPVLAADPRAHLVFVNEAARRVFPRALPGAALTDVVPAWLAAAHARQVADTVPAGRPASGAHGPALGQVGEESYEAHPTVRDDGTVVWWLVDDTDHRLAREALRTAEERTAFLVRSSNL
ncbi:serine/threonine protein phosphatase, partial [Streptomyces sp. SID7760]|nr:serine/threonine protein phosphatase [Streptomyces sp. SID7760]